MNEMRKLMEAVSSTAQTFSLEFEYDPNDPGVIGWAYKDDTGNITVSGNDAIRDIPEIVQDMFKQLRIQ